MSILFNQIPGNIRVPFTYFEVNAGQAPYESNAALLLIGQMITTGAFAGTAPPNIPVEVFGNEDGLFGAGSMLATMYKLARSLAPFQEIWALPLADPTGGAATGSISLDGPPWGYDSAIFYVGDIRVAVPVQISDTPAVLANRIVAYINALRTNQGNFAGGCTGMQVTATHVAGTVATGTLTIPSAWAGVAATKVFTLTVTGNTAAQNAVYTYSVPLLVGDTTSTVATKTAAAINAVTSTTGYVGVVSGVNVTVSSVASTGLSGTFSGYAASGNVNGGTPESVTLTANNVGALGNTIRIETNLTTGDSSWAANYALVTQLSGGTGVPLLTTPLANLGDKPFDWIVNPYSDVTSLSTVAAFLANRWGPSSQVYGFQISAFTGTAATSLAQVLPLNSQYTSVMPLYNTPAPSYLWAAAIGAQAAQHLQDAPELSRPLQTLPLTGLHAPKNLGDRWSALQRQSFYFGGLSGYTTARDGTPLLDRVVTTYLTNAYGQVDMTWLDINTLAQCMYALRFLNQKFTSTYPRVGLADQNPGNLQGIVTIKDIRNLIIHGYTNLCTLGVMQNADLFEQLLVVERNAQDPNRVDAYLPVNVTNQLRILASNMTVYLQYPS